MKVDLSMFGSHLRRFRPSHMPHLKIKDLTILDFCDLTPVVALLVPRNNVQSGSTSSVPGLQVEPNMTLLRVHTANI